MGMLLFDHAVPDNRCQEELVSEPGHIHAVYAECMVENVLSLS